MNWSRVITIVKNWSQTVESLDLTRDSLLNLPKRVIREFSLSLTGCQLSWRLLSVSWHFWMSSSTLSFEASWEQDVLFSSQVTNSHHSRRNSASRQSLWARTPRYMTFLPSMHLWHQQHIPQSQSADLLNHNWCTTFQGATDNSMLNGILPSGLKPLIPLGTLVAAVLLWCKSPSQ